MSDDFDKIFQRYVKQFGTVVNTDNVKLLFRENGYIPSSEESVRAFHPEAAKLTGKIFQRFLENAKSGDIVVFTGGGNGSGKSTLIRNFKSAAMIMDSTMASADATRQGIQNALSHKMCVVLAYVHREPIDAWVNGICVRVSEGGHITPKSVFANAHAVSRNNFLNMSREFMGKVSLRIRDNTWNREISIGELSEKRTYTKDEILEQINEFERISRKKFQSGLDRRSESVGNSPFEKPSDYFETSSRGTENPVEGNQSQCGDSDGRNSTSGKNDFFLEQKIESQYPQIVNETLTPSFIPLSVPQKKLLGILIAQAKIPPIAFHELSRMSFHDGEKILTPFSRMLLPSTEKKMKQDPFRIEL